MKLGYTKAALVLACSVGFVNAAEYGTREYCIDLSMMGKNAYVAKINGNSLTKVKEAVANILQNDLKKRDAAIGVITAIYGDNSISSSNKAYAIVYDACTRNL